VEAGSTQRHGRVARDQRGKQKLSNQTRHRNSRDRTSEANTITFIS
jgi:hypothetical protein